MMSQRVFFPLHLSHALAVLIRLSSPSASAPSDPAAAAAAPDVFFFLGLTPAALPLPSVEDGAVDLRFFALLLESGAYCMAKEEEDGSGD